LISIDIEINGQHRFGAKIIKIRVKQHFLTLLFILEISKTRLMTRAPHGSYEVE